MNRFVTASLLFAAVLGILVSLPTLASAQEQLTVQFTPSSAGGEYAPANIEAVWVLSGTDFVKTIGRWAGTRRSHLVAWRAAAGATDVDSVSGATNDDYIPLSLTWDLTDRAGAMIADGTYTIRIESCDANSTLESENHQATLTFNKNGTASTQTPTVDGFSNVTVTYTGRAAETDAGTPPADSGTPPADSGTPPADSGTPPVDLGGGTTDGGGSGVAPASGGCNVTEAPTSTYGWLAVAAALGMARWARKRRTV